MEQQNILQEILGVLKQFSVNIDQKIAALDQKIDQKIAVLDQKIDQLNQKMDEKFDETNERLSQVENRLDRIEKKLDGFHVELTETQESVEFLLTKNAQHEKKLRELQKQ